MNEYSAKRSPDRRGQTGGGSQVAQTGGGSQVAQTGGRSQVAQTGGKRADMTNRRLTRRLGPAAGQPAAYRGALHEGVGNQRKLDLRTLK